mmetsp:Transcript_44751/g.127762  ORF Transcript_44751/g.127762 Transcript_44751/m.127762 type:complete len:85 (-) Transcript_44751:70-324(-)
MSEAGKCCSPPCVRWQRAEPQRAVRVGVPCAGVPPPCRCSVQSRAAEPAAKGSQAMPDAAGSSVRGGTLKAVHVHCRSDAILGP